MDGVTFPTWRDGRYVELTEVVELLRPRVAGLSWRLAVEEAVSTSERGAAERLVDDVEMTLTELLEMTAEVQIIDGEVIGRTVGSRGDAVVIAAVDSTWRDVYAADSGVLRLLCAAFPDAEEIRAESFTGQSLIGAKAARRATSGRSRRGSRRTDRGRTGGV